VSESRSDDEDEGVFGDVDVDVDVGVDLDGDLEDGMDGARVRRARVNGSRVGMWKTEDGDAGVTGISMREDEQEDAEYDKGVKMGLERRWDGTEMEMEMD
jgi:hypothetical protein